MATPIFKFTDLETKQDYYFIYDTFSESQKTSPVCLSTFLYYHIETNRTLSGFIESFKKVLTTGASLNHTTFELFFSEKEKIFFQEHLVEKDSFELRKESEMLKDFLLSNEIDECKLIEFIQTHCLHTKDMFKGVEFYESLVVRALFSKSINQTENGDARTEDDDLPF